MDIALSCEAGDPGSIFRGEIKLIFDCVFFNDYNESIFRNQ